MTHEQLHLKALAVADRFLGSVAEVLEILIELDAQKTFEVYECSSLFKYAVRYLKLSEDVAVSAITVARKAVLIPALRRELRDGNIPLSKARNICSVLDDTNHDHWLGLAKTLTSKQLQREVAKTNSQAAVTERLTYVEANRLRLQVRYGGQKEMWVSPGQEKTQTNPLPRLSQPMKRRETSWDV